MKYEEKIRSLNAVELAKLLRSAKRSDDVVVEEVQDRTNRYFPLSLAQKRLWIQSQIEKDNPTFNIPLAQIVKIEKQLDLVFLEGVVNQIIAKNEILRTTFHLHQGQPVQQIKAQLSVQIKYKDLRGIPHGYKMEKAIEVSNAEAKGLFDLEKGPLIRFSVFHIEQFEYVFLTVMHHLISDGWSNNLFFSALAAGIFSVEQTGPMPAQYLDYVFWEKNRFEKRNVCQSLEYWKSLLSGELPRTEFPRKIAPNVAEGFLYKEEDSTKGTQKVFPIESGLNQQAREFSKKNRTTLFVTMLSVFQVLLYRYTMEKDLLIGLPYANRLSAEFHRTLGLFVNLLPLRTRIEKNKTFAAYLNELDSMTREMFAKEGISFDILVDRLQLRRSQIDPIFHILFVHQNFPHTHEMPGVQLTPFPVDTGHTQYGMVFIVEEFNGRMCVKIKYKSCLYDDCFIDQIFVHYKNILSSAIFNPEQPLAKIQCLSQEEKNWLFEKGHHPSRNRRNYMGSLESLLSNSGSVAFEKNPDSIQKAQTSTGTEVLESPVLFCAAFEAQVVKTPQVTALECSGTSLTYLALNRRANRLAHKIRKLNLPAEARIGLFVERNITLIVALLGILKSGACFVPIETTFPEERIRYMLQETGVSLLLTESRFISQVEVLGISYLLADSSFEEENGENLSLHISPSDLAYVIFTSGSTGRPKGVGIEHKGLASYIESIAWETAKYHLKRFAFTSTIAADMGYTNLFLPLSQGGSVVIVPKEISDDPNNLSAYLRNFPVDCVKFVPSQLTFLLKTDDPVHILPRKLLILAGEATPYQLIQRVKKLKPSCEVIASYGPTEATVGAMTNQETGKLRGIGKVALGHPNLHSSIYLLDNEMELVPRGAVGEICIGGDCLARGYFNRPELTADKFVANPYSGHKDARLYRTGDLARYLENGEVEFLGRRDKQVKIRGHRVELGEVETAILRSHKQIEQAVAILTQEGLAAWIICQAEVPLSEKWVKEKLREALPSHMVPSRITILKQYPLTSSGKVDVLSLQYQALESHLDPRKRPRDAIEQTLQKIWGEVLKIEEIAIDEPFFDLGGHSFLALELVLKIEKTFGVKISLATLFQKSTIEKLAEVIRGGGGFSAYQNSLVVIREGISKPSLFFVHPAGGQVLCYNDLTKFLRGNFPIYGFQSPFMDEEPQDSIEKIARRYLEEIPCNEGFLLGGWSLGGLIAFEMARAVLQQTGYAPLVLLIDQPNPSFSRQKFLDEYALRFLNQVKAFSEVKLEIPYDKLRRKPFAEQAALIYKIFIEQSLLPKDVKIEHFITFLDYQKKQSEASSIYEPGCYQGPVLLIRATESHWNKLGVEQPRELAHWEGTVRPEQDLAVSKFGWEKVAPNLTTKWVEGTHVSIMKSPIVEKIAREIELWLGYRV